MLKYSDRPAVIHTYKRWEKGSKKGPKMAEEGAIGPVINEKRPEKHQELRKEGQQGADMA